MDFRPAFQALADRLEADLAEKVKAVTRRNLGPKAFKHQPALCVLELGGEPVDGESTVDGGYERLDAALVLHSRIDGDASAPGDAVLELVAAIRAALEWRAGELRGPSGSRWTTLGGVVRAAWLGSWSVQDDDEDVAQVTTELRVSMLVEPPA